MSSALREKEPDRGVDKRSIWIGRIAHPYVEDLGFAVVEERSRYYLSERFSLCENNSSCFNAPSRGKDVIKKRQLIDITNVRSKAEKAFASLGNNQSFFFR